MFNLKDFEYKIDNKEITLIKYNGIGKKMFIPEEVEGVRITKISDYCFYENNTIEKLKLSKNIEYVGLYAFSRTTKLQEVLIAPDIKLKKINVGTFQSSSLVKINIPPKIEEIDDYAFYMSIFLGVIEFSTNSILKRIGKYAFSHNLLIVEIEIPNSVETIDDYAFYKSTSIDKIVLPINLKKIGTKAFNDIMYLKNVVIDDDCSLESIGREAFSGYSKLSSFKITKRVKEILPGALGCLYLEDLVVDQENPYFVIKDECIYNKDLTELYLVNPYKRHEKLIIKDDVYIHELAFLNSYGPLDLIIGKNVKNINSNTFTFNGNENKVVKVLDDNYKVVDNCLYNKDMTELLLFLDYGKKEYRYPNTIKEINDTHLLKDVRKIVIPKEVVRINDRAFYYLRNLEQVIFEENSELEYIGSQAFDGCLSIKEIKIPKSVKYIGENAFNICYDAKIYLEHNKIPLSWDKSWNYNNATVILKDKSEITYDLNQININENSPAKDAIKAYLKLEEFLTLNKEVGHKDIYLIILGVELYARFLMFDDINLLIKGEKFIKDLSSYFNPLIKKYGKNFETLLSFYSSYNKYNVYLTHVGILRLFYFINDDRHAFSFLMYATEIENTLEDKLNEKILIYDELYNIYLLEIEKYITLLTKTKERPEMLSTINTVRPDYEWED